MKKEAVLAAVLGALIVAVLGYSLLNEFAKERNFITSAATLELENPSAITCPVAQGKITAGFRSKLYRAVYPWDHNGVDFGNPVSCGTPVYAMADGTATFYYDTSAGNWVKIDHGNGITSRYLHFSRFNNAKTGTSIQVKKGELIGYAGKTGVADGCHLHFEIRQQGNPLNPVDYTCKNFECEQGWCDGYVPTILTQEETELLKYVDKKTKLEREYPPPSSLVDLRDYIPSIRAADSRASRLLTDDLKEMMKEAENAGVEIYIQSAYRSYEAQEKLFKSYVNDEILKEQRNGRQITEEEAVKRANAYSAIPGNSEHQLGTAIDFSTPENSHELEASFANTKAGKWIYENAEKYGFVLSYPEGKESLTGYQYEPWHYRYLGKKFAQEIMNKDYKNAKKVTVNSFIQEKMAALPSLFSPGTLSAEMINYDAHILYAVKPSFKEEINYDISEIEKLKATAKEIAECKTDDCVKEYNNKEIEGLSWKLGKCEENEEERFNELTQLIQDCSSEKGDYCSCGTYSINFGKEHDVRINQEENKIKLILLRNKEELMEKEIGTKIEVLNPSTAQKADVNEIFLNQFCSKYSEFCERNSQIMLGKHNSVVIMQQRDKGAILPTYPKCGTGRIIIMDAAPAVLDYWDWDLFSINILHAINNRIKDSDERLAITKLTTVLPRGSHADSIGFVNSYKEKAEAYITVIIDKEEKRNGFKIRHANNQKSREFAETLKNKLPETFKGIQLITVIEEVDYANVQNQDSKDFLILSTKAYEKDIPIVMLVVSKGDIIKDNGNADPEFQQAISNAIYDSLSEKFADFNKISRKEIYPFCVESKQKIFAYDKIKGKAELKNVQYKFAVRIG